MGLKSGAFEWGAGEVILATDVATGVSAKDTAEGVFPVLERIVEKMTRSSFGCVRVYEKAQPLIYAKTQMGTKVEVVGESLVEKYGE